MPERAGPGHLSGVDLPAGRNRQRAGALAFVRQRHGLEGGDLDRIARQQAFPAGLTQRLQSTGTLSDPAGSTSWWAPSVGTSCSTGAGTSTRPLASSAASPVTTWCSGPSPRAGPTSDTGRRDRRRGRRGRGAQLRRLGPLNPSVTPGITIVRANTPLPPATSAASRVGAAERRVGRLTRPVQHVPGDHCRRHPLRRLTDPAGRLITRDRQFPASPGAHPAVHPRRPARCHRLPGRRPCRVPAQPRRYRPGHLPVDARRGDRGRTPRRRSRAS